MYLARITAQGPDGQEARVVAASSLDGPWTDVRTHHRCSLQVRGASRAGALRVASALIPGSLASALEAGDAFMDAARAAAQSDCAESSVENPLEFLAPVDPPAYRDFMVFERHFEFGYKWRGVPVPDVMYEMPISYQGSSASIVGPETIIDWPHYSSHMDYELELGIVLGRSTSNISPEDALKNVLGLTILNDFSGRDIQGREMQGGLGPCKGKHFATAIGPVIATLDVLSKSGLEVRSRVNGDLWCHGTSSEMIWSISEIVAWASAGEKLAAGTLLGSGTVNGGSAVELGRRLAPGDVVELEVTGLGMLRNRIGEIGKGWMPRPRQRGKARHIGLDTIEAGV